MTTRTAAPLDVNRGLRLAPPSPPRLEGGARAARPRLLALVLGALLGIVLGPRAGDAGPLDDQLAEARRALVRELEAVATWCHQNQVFAARDRTYEAILRVDPDHARSRASLKYTRAKKGPWERRDEYKAPSDWNKGLAPEAAKRLAGALAGYRTRIEEIVAAQGEALRPQRRVAIQEGLVDLLPDDPDLRRSRGDVEHGGRWLLPETVEGIERRTHIAAMARKASEDVSPPQPDPDAAASGWRAGVRTARFEVYGDAPEAECRGVASLLEAGHGFLGSLLGPVNAAPTPRQILIFDDPNRARRWLMAQGADHLEAQRTFEHVTAVWIPNGANMRYHPDPVARRMGAARQLLQRGIGVRFEGDRDRGWISEGLGQRLCWHLAGRHGAAFVNIGRTERATDRGEGALLPDPEQPWLPAAARALAEDPAPKIHAVLTMRLNAMRVEEVLVAYALAAYVLEGRPEGLAPLLKATLTLDDADRQSLDAFGVDADTLAWRVRRWVLESAGL